MFRTKRDFKAVVFVFPNKQFPGVRSHAEVLRLFPKGSISKDKDYRPSVEKHVSDGAWVVHATYLSTKYYPRTDDEKLREAIQTEVNGETYYRYNIYLLGDGPNDSSEDLSCAVCVPFAAMCKDVFNDLHKAGKQSRPKYRRILLNDALKLLQSGENEQSKITVRRVDFPIEDANIDYMSIFGKNVVGSDEFKKGSGFLKSKLDKTEPDASKFCYEVVQDGVFGLTVDKLGNFSFRVMRDAGLLGYFFSLLRFFQKHHATEDVKEWPWRGGKGDTSNDEDEKE